MRSMLIMNNNPDPIEIPFDYQSDSAIRCRV